MNNENSYNDIQMSDIINLDDIQKSRLFSKHIYCSNNFAKNTYYNCFCKKKKILKSKIYKNLTLDQLDWLYY